jgi:hypothetical protein
MRTLIEEFNQIDPLTAGQWTAVVQEGICIKIEGTEDFDEDGLLDSIWLESVAEARALRDWLTATLPANPHDEHKP